MSRQPIEFGTAKEVFGEVTRGTLPLLSLPTGDKFELKVVIASGVEDGPTFLVTANIHGDEVTGVLVVHRFLEFLAQTPIKAGRVVIIPSLNPSGHLAGTFSVL